MPQGSGSQTDQPGREELLEQAIQLGLPEHAAEVRLAMAGGLTEFRRELKTLRAASNMLGKKEGLTKLRELGRDGLEKFMKRMKNQRNLPPLARKQQGDIVLADVTWDNIRTTTGFAWVVVTDGVRQLAKLDLLIVFNGKLKGPVAKLPRKTKGHVRVQTFGHGLVLSETDWAAFGLLPPKGRPFSSWEPCYFEGDPDNKASLTSVKRLADSIDVDEKLASIMSKLRYNKRPGGGIPISFLKRAVNDTMRLAGFDSKPKWTTCEITTDSTVEDIEQVQDLEAQKRLKAFWFDDSEGPDADESNSIWDDGDLIEDDSFGNR